MSQRAVEQTLGKLITDEGFRKAFFADPAGTALRAGLELTGKELEALSRIPARAVATLCACVDDRICRLPVPSGSRWEEIR
jgi:hypothetical protein